MSPPLRPHPREDSGPPHLELGSPLVPAVLPCPWTFLTGSWQEALRSDFSAFQMQKRKAEGPAWGTVKGVQGLGRSPFSGTCCC